MNCRMHRMLHQIVLGCVFAVLGPLGAFNVGGSAQSYAFGRADVGTGASPAAIVTGDFNGDSKLDLATVNSVDNTVSILLGKPDGTFQPHLDLKVGSFPLALAHVCGICGTDFDKPNGMSGSLAVFGFS